MWKGSFEDGYQSGLIRLVCSDIYESVEGHQMLANRVVDAKAGPDCADLREVFSLFQEDDKGCAGVAFSPVRRVHGVADVYPAEGIRWTLETRPPYGPLSTEVHDQSGEPPRITWRGCKVLAAHPPCIQGLGRE